MCVCVRDRVIDGEGSRIVVSTIVVSVLVTRSSQCSGP